MGAPPSGSSSAYEVKFVGEEDDGFPPARGFGRGVGGAWREEGRCDDKAELGRGGRGGGGAVPRTADSSVSKPREILLLKKAGRLACY